MSTYRTYLRTLRRVPDDVILSAVTRSHDLTNGNACVCGWVVREAIARIRNADASAIWPEETRGTSCATLFGGSTEEWEAIYHGVVDEPTRQNRITGDAEPNPVCRLPDIERALVERVLEAV